MIRPLALVLLMALPAAAEDVAQEAQQAAADLRDAVAAMEEAGGAKDRVAALTRTIRAYEEGLDALREGLRQATIRESALALQFEAKREQVAQLVGVLSSMETDPGPLLLLHPTGALGTARSGMMLAEITPALQAEAEQLRSELEEVKLLRALQQEAGATLTAGLKAVQDARSTLSQAISDRTDLPRRITEDPEALQKLLASAETLDAFAAGLTLGADASNGQQDFEAAKGSLPLPALGAWQAGCRGGDDPLSWPAARLRKCDDP